LFKTILNAAVRVGTYLPSEDKLKIQFPLMSSTDESLWVGFCSDFGRFVHVMQAIEISVGNMQTKIAGTMDVDGNLIQDCLIALAESNGVAHTLANDVAIAASCEYVRMMDNVLSYYVSSCCCVPKNVIATATYTMPFEYYGYGRPPPGLNYLTAGAQVLYAIQKDGAKEYVRTKAAIEEMSISGIDHSEAQKPQRFIELGLHSAMVFPRRTMSFCIEPGQTVIPLSAYILADKFPQVFPVRSNPKINPNIIPRSVMLNMGNKYRDNCQALERISLSSTTLTLVGEKMPEQRGNYVSDSLM
jgi:hypothetical protein